MQKKIITLATMAVMMCAVAVAQTVLPNVSYERDLIEELLDRGRWGEARQQLDALRSRLSPTTDREDIEWVEYNYVRCAVELDLDDADAMMRQYIAKHPSSVYANDMQHLLACYYCDKGDLERAESEFQLVRYKGLDTRDRERYDIRMGYIRFVQGDHLTADAHYHRIGANSDYYSHALYYMSYIDYLAERNDEAKYGFEKLLDTKEYRNLAPFYLMQIEYRNGNYDYVIENGERLMSTAYGEVEHDLARIIAESYFKRGDYKKAYSYMAAYPKEKMGRQENYIVGYSLYRQVLYREAIEPLKAVCGVDDELTQNASYHLGDCYLRCGDKMNAANAFAMASVGGYDENIAKDALLNYGRLKFELGGGLFNESINVLQNYLVRYPKAESAAEVRSLLIAAYYNSRNYDAAYAAIKEFDDPDDEMRAALQKVATLRAVEAVERGDLDMAEGLLAEAERIGINSKYNALVLYWKGEVAFLRGDMATAKECFQSYLRRAPKSETEYAFANYGIGYCNFNEKNMKEAADAFENFVRDYTKRDNYLYDGHNRLGDARFAARDFSAARRAYKVSSVSASQEARDYARYQLAMVDGVESKTRSKIDRLKGIIMDNASGYVDDAWYELGKTYIGAERYADGAATLQDFVDIDTLSPYYTAAMSDLGLAYYNLGQKSLARKCYEEVVEREPQSALAMEAMRGIREIYVQEGNVAGYIAYAENCGLQSDLSAAARDSLTFAAAKRAYLDGEMEDAAVKLKSYLADFEKGYNRTEALFYFSDYYVQSENTAAAIETMNELVQQGQSQYTERVLRVLAPMTFDEKQYDKSAEAYRNLYDVASTEEIRRRAADGYVEATIIHGDAEAIKRMADDVAKMKSVSEWAVRNSMLAKAHILSDEGNVSETNKLYAELSKSRKDDVGAEAYYHLIADKYSAGDYSGAEQMVYEFGESGSMYWQAKSFILLGDILVKQNNIFQARATYQSIVDGYSPADDGIVDEAKARIKALK